MVFAVDELLIRTRCSKPLEDYDQRNRTVSALQRYAAHDIPRSPGQDVYYVVVNDERNDAERVRLPFEMAEEYDDGFYVDQAIDAAQSVLAPLGWGGLSDSWVPADRAQRENLGMGVAL